MPVCPVHCPSYRITDFTRENHGWRTVSHDPTVFLTRSLHKETSGNPTGEANCPTPSRLGRFPIGHAHPSEPSRDGGLILAQRNHWFDRRGAAGRASVVISTITAPIATTITMAAIMVIAIALIIVTEQTLLCSGHHDGRRCGYRWANDLSLPQTGSLLELDVAPSSRILSVIGKPHFFSD
jgi:hypothetical protein